MGSIKRTILVLLLTSLVLVEIYLLTLFLPMRWQLAVYGHISNILSRSDDRLITHPLLSQEIEQVLHEHIGIRIGLLTLAVILVIANAWIIRRIWRLLTMH